MVRWNDRWMASIAIAGVAGLVLGGCPKKGPSAEELAAAAPKVGWEKQEGWLSECWFPPDFESLGIADKRMERNNSLDAMMEQWRGDRGDGVEFDPVAIENVETVLLGRPEKIETVAAENLGFCQQAMAGRGMGGWEEWLVQLPRKLTEGECRRPLDDTMFWYLELENGWQFNQSICDDDVVTITASSNDYYKVSADGPWINADGDRSQPTAGDYPCNVEGCFLGQLVMRFRGDSGVEIVKPVGVELRFDPPEHGSIEIMVNDKDLYDNEWKVERGVQHRTQITYAPQN